MAFNPQTAKPVSKFDLSTAKPINQVTTTAELPVDYRFGESVRNFLPSLGKVVTDFAGALVNYDDTINAIGTLAESGLQNLAQELHDSLPKKIQTEYPKYLTPRMYEAMGFDKSESKGFENHTMPNQEMGEQFLGYLGDRYGGKDEIKTTLMKDPAGVLADISGIVTGGATIAGKSGSTVANIASKLDPITGIVKAPTAAIEMLGQPLSHKLYGSAMKPSTTLDINPRESVISAGLELGAMPTVKSTKRIEAERQRVGAELDEALAKSDKLGRVVDGEGLLADVANVRDKFAPPKPSSTTALPDIDAVVDNIREAIFLNGGRKLTIREVNDIKTDLYRQINFDRSQRVGGSAKTMSDATEQANKQIAQTARDIVAKHAPDVVPLNDRYGKIVDVQRNIQQQGTNRIQNADLVGLSDPVKIGASQAVGGDMGGVVGTVATVVDKATPKAALAIGINRAGKVARSPKAVAAIDATSLAGRYEQAVLADEQEREAERLRRQLLRED